MREQARILRWEEPPPAKSVGGRPPGGTRSRWAEVAEELRARPGRSAVIAEGESRQFTDLAWRINHGLMRPFSPAGAFEATTRQDYGTVTVYARYVGGARS